MCTSICSFPQGMKPALESAHVFLVSGVVACTCPAAVELFARHAHKHNVAGGGARTVGGTPVEISRSTFTHWG